MNPTSFMLFIDLVKFDQSIMKSKQSLEVLKQKQLVYLQKLKQIVFSSEEVQVQLRHMKKNVDEKECYMKDLDEKEKALKDRSTNVSGDREYKSLKKESENLRAKQYAFEKELLQAWDQYETGKKQIEEKEKAFDEQEALLQIELNAVSDHISQEEKVLEQLERQRPEHEVNVPEDWLSKYSRMRSAVANPVVPVQSESCSACFGAVSQQELAAISNHEILPCRSCFRLLYDPTTYTHAVGGVL